MIGARQLGISSFWGLKNMGVFRQLVQGLYLAGGFAALLFLGEAFSPGTLGAMAFSPIAFIALFAMMALEAVYSLR